MPGPAAALPGAALALLAGAPRRAAGMAGVSLAVGLGVELGLAAGLGPVRPAAGPADAAASSLNLVALLYGRDGAGAWAWFLRWLAATLLAGWLYGEAAALWRARAAPGAGEAGEAAPRWERLPALLGTLASLAVALLLPLSLGLWLGLPTWLALLALAWPALRLSVAPPAAMLAPRSPLGALADSWRRTRRRELYAGWVMALALAPPALAAWLVLTVAVYVPAWFASTWWLALAGCWLYLPVFATVQLLLWLRLGQRREEDEAEDEPAGGVADDGAPAP